MVAIRWAWVALGTVTLGVAGVALYENAWGLAPTPRTSALLLLVPAAALFVAHIRDARRRRLRRYSLGW
ncbi:MAG: hypothetical protein ACYDDF_10080 [Thermoplasmatota archaeon]